MIQDELTWEERSLELTGPTVIFSQAALPGKRNEIKYNFSMTIYINVSRVHEYIFSVFTLSVTFAGTQQEFYG